MKRYLSIYKSFFRFSFSNFTAFRANAINNIIATSAWGAFQFIWIQLLTIRTQSAFGWTRDELVILAILYIIIIGVFHFFFTRNFDRFSRIIDQGELDFLLLKPIDSQFIATCLILNFPNLIRVLLGTILLMVYLSVRHISLPLIGIMGFFVFVVFGVILLYSLWLFYSSILIWFPRLTNIIEFLYTINGMGRYPTEMIEGLRNILVLFLLPFSIAIATPAKILVRGTLQGDGWMLMAISLGMFILSRFWWKFALRFYTSASS